MPLNTSYILHPNRLGGCYTFDEFIEWYPENSVVRYECIGVVGEVDVEDEV
jgi:hypothetical protein